MRVVVELATPEVLSTTSASLILKDPESDLPVAEIAVRGAGYVVLTEEERRKIAEAIQEFVQNDDRNLDSTPEMDIPDREGGYHGEPRLWEEVAAAQAAKRGSTKVVTIGGRKTKVYESLSDIPYPEGATFGADGIIEVPSRKLDSTSPTAKSFRRACKRAKASQLAFLAAQKDPSSVSEGEEDEEGAEE